MWSTISSHLCSVSPPLRCHRQASLLGVAFVQVPPLLGCHLQSLLLSASSIQLLLLFRCHLQPPLLGATFLQMQPLLDATSNHLCLVPPLLRCHLCLGRCHPSLGVTSAQMPPPAGYHLCSGATSAQMPPSGWKRSVPVSMAPRILLRCCRAPHSAGSPSSTIYFPTAPTQV